MSNRGKTPSLLSGTAGKVSFCAVARKTDCMRCKMEMPKGTKRVKVSKPNTLGGYKSYCLDCFEKVLDETQRGVDSLKVELRRHR